MRIHRMKAAFGVVLVFASAGCEGSIYEPTGRPIDETSPWGTPDEPTIDECAERAPSVGATPLRRLTQEQYRNTVRDVLGFDLPADAARRLLDIPDGREGGFASSADAPGAEPMQGYVAMAEVIARTLIAEHLGAWTGGCAIAERTCVESTLERLAAALFRRAIARGVDGELTPYLGAYDTLAMEQGAPAALETVVTALLASPKFLYRAEEVRESDAAGEVVPLAPHALANRLSYYLWNGPPDDALRAAAESGALADDGALAREVDRMLADPRASRAIRSFHAQWLRLDELEGVESGDAAFTPELRESMREETLGFLEHVVREGDGALGTMLSADWTIGDARVAAHYGVAAPASGTGRIDLDAGERAGILTHASILTQFGDVYPEIHRGLFVRASLLCDSPPPPPEGIVPAGAATRLSTEPCRTCHQRMDLIGFGFADFDPLGRYQPRDAEARAADPQPDLRSPDGSLDPAITGEFETPRELADRLADSSDVRSCVSTQWIRFATGRREQTADACEVLALRTAFEESGGDVRALMRSIALSPGFRVRAASEVSPVAEGDAP